ncbi:uncharacterized protein TA16430 [Theileria annulata]|uniref:Uncharacterized protein n=1 Tax=Theileria annulata TaxID=5874 RepID=Q4UIW2_THEAN|nr:uncharacterized protein TA16430 [Theileria annulata]CAI72977.1 hypothetical protein TA16430 [Theileria annulata]|eukprot:XP_953655.1 hypothetical protein TA16430 [Theileria annulata]
MESVTNRIEKLKFSENKLESDGNLKLSDNSFPLVHTERFTVTDSNGTLNPQFHYHNSDEDTEYTLTALKFSNSWQLFLTYSGNVGTWLCSSADLSHLDIYSTKVLLGDRTKEYYQIYSRNGIKVLCDCLREKNKIDKYSPTGFKTCLSNF